MSGPGKEVKADWNEVYPVSGMIEYKDMKYCSCHHNNNEKDVESFFIEEDPFLEGAKDNAINIAKAIRNGGKGE